MRLTDKFQRALTGPARFSYGFILLLFVLIGWLHLGGPLVAALFAYLALNRLQFLPRAGKWLAVALFVVLLSAAGFTLGRFINQTVRALPEIADQAIPKLIQIAKKYEVELAFTDYDSLKEAAIETVKSQARYLGSFARFARGAGHELILIILGLVVAIAFYLYPHFDLPKGKDPSVPPNNLFTLCTDAIRARFSTFFRSFEMVLGAQIIISGINTLFTAIFVVAVDLPYALVIMGVTFLCGLVPVIGNLISNTIIVGIGFTISPRMALFALIFLVVIHKLEYFLNSKIIGHRIRNPVWLTLLALILGERLMGIPGIILAPVFLHYLKTECSAVRAMPDPASTRVAEAAAAPMERHEEVPGA